MSKPNQVHQLSFELTAPLVAIANEYGTSRDPVARDMSVRLAACHELLLTIEMALKQHAPNPVVNKLKERIHTNLKGCGFNQYPDIYFS